MAGERIYVTMLKLKQPSTPVLQPTSWTTKQNRVLELSRPYNTTSGAHAHGKTERRTRAAVHCSLSPAEPDNNACVYIVIEQITNNNGTRHSSVCSLPAERFH